MSVLEDRVIDEIMREIMERLEIYQPDLYPKTNESFTFIKFCIGLPSTFANPKAIVVHSYDIEVQVDKAVEWVLDKMLEYLNEYVVDVVGPMMDDVKATFQIFRTTLDVKAKEGDVGKMETPTGAI